MCAVLSFFDYIFNYWALIKIKKMYERIFINDIKTSWSFRLLEENNKSNQFTNIKEKTIDLENELLRKFGPDSQEKEIKKWIFEWGSGILYHNIEHSKHVMQSFKSLLKTTNNITKWFRCPSNFFSPLDIELLTLIIGYHDIRQLFYKKWYGIKTERVSMWLKNEIKSASFAIGIIDREIKQWKIYISCEQIEIKRIINKLISMTEPTIFVNKITGNLHIASKAFNPHLWFLIFFYAYVADLCQCGCLDFDKYLNNVCNLFFEKHIWILDVIKSKKIGNKDIAYIWEAFTIFFEKQSGFIEEEEEIFSTMLEKTTWFDKIFNWKVEAGTVLRKEISKHYSKFKSNSKNMQKWYENMQKEFNILKSLNWNNKENLIVFSDFLSNLSNLFTNFL